jgi:ribosomal protein S18 acetylase RimI-like enzyme
MPCSIASARGADSDVPFRADPLENGPVHPTQAWTVVPLAEGAGPIARRILTSLPAWFGIPDAVEDYVELADRTPSFVARSDEDEAVGFLTLVRHGPHAAEVAVMGVLPEYHRHGIGRRLIEAAESSLRVAGVEYLQVKTLSAASPDEGYARTRAFYQALGFRVLEELADLWDARNPAVLLVKRI